MLAACASGYFVLIAHDQFKGMGQTAANLGQQSGFFFPGERPGHDKTAFDPFRPGLNELVLNHRCDFAKALGAKVRSISATVRRDQSVPHPAQDAAKNR